LFDTVDSTGAKVTGAWTEVYDLIQNMAEGISKAPPNAQNTLRTAVNTLLRGLTNRQNTLRAITTKTDPDYIDRVQNLELLAGLCNQVNQKLVDNGFTSVDVVGTDFDASGNFNVDTENLLDPDEYFDVLVADIQADAQSFIKAVEGITTVPEMTPVSEIGSESSDTSTIDPNEYYDASSTLSDAITHIFTRISTDMQLDSIPQMPETQQTTIARLYKKIMATFYKVLGNREQAFSTSGATASEVQEYNVFSNVYSSTKATGDKTINSIEPLGVDNSQVDPDTPDDIPPSPVQAHTQVVNIKSGATGRVANQINRRQATNKRKQGGGLPRSGSGTVGRS
jgi:hypothetical protein